MVKEIKSVDDFKNEVQDSKGLVLVDFWAEWCGPCRALAPIFSKLDEEMDDVKFVKVDVDENGQIAAQFRITSIPTLILFKDGEMVDMAMGALPEPMLKDFIEKHRD